MNLDNLQRKLMAAARATQPSDRVPYAFEKRIMARIMAARADLMSAWGAALWRGAVSCVAIVVLSGTWSLWSNYQRNNREFSQEFETAVFASADSMEEAW